jgi:hypothetical protein
MVVGQVPSGNAIRFAVNLWSGHLGDCGRALVQYLFLFASLIFGLFNCILLINRKEK